MHDEKVNVVLFLLRSVLLKTGVVHVHVFNNDVIVSTNWLAELLWENGNGIWFAPRMNSFPISITFQIPFPNSRLIVQPI